MPHPNPVVSIGYEGRTPDQFVALLKMHKVRKVLDVRELPLSRRKGFSKTPLSNLLRTRGIAYEHLRAAGNPHRRLKATTPAECLDLYTKHIEAHPEVVDSVRVALEDGPVAVLCFERAHDQCHRSRLLAAVAQTRAQPRRHWRVIRVE